MPNYYSIYTAAKSLPCNKATYLRLRALLAQLKDDEDHGFALLLEDGEVFLQAEESGTPDNIPDAFLVEFGKLIKSAGLKYLSVGGAFSCERLLPGSHGGEEFRISPEGDIYSPAIIWPKAVAD